MNISLNIFVYDLWYLRYREYPYSGTISIQLLSPIEYTILY